jgi:hypothetical protein
VIGLAMLTQAALLADGPGQQEGINDSPGQIGDREYANCDNKGPANSTKKCYGPNFKVCESQPFGACTDTSAIIPLAEPIPDGCVERTGKNCSEVDIECYEETVCLQITPVGGFPKCVPFVLFAGNVTSSVKKVAVNCPTIN